MYLLSKYDFANSEKVEPSILIITLLSFRNFLTMCHTNTTQSSNNGNERRDNNWQEHAQAQEQLYPNLDQMLNNLLSENQSQFLRSFFAGNGDTTSPSAPPPNPSSDNPNPTAPPPPFEENQGWNRDRTQDQYQWNWNQWNHPCGGWRMPDYSNMQSQPRPRHSFNNENADDFGFLFQRIGQRIAMNFVKSLGFLAMMAPVLMAPKFLLVLGIFASILKSFGIPIAPLVLAGISWEILTALDPILITLLAFWTIWKTWICNKPLIDIAYWRSRISHHCHTN